MTLAEDWFLIKSRLCESFSGLDPIRLLDYPLVDVLDLVGELIRHNNRLAKMPGRSTEKSNERIIYRKADDSWF